MGWIKRNLFLVVGGILTIGLLGGAGFFIYKGWSSNSEASQSLSEIYGRLSELSQSPVQPGNDKIDNTKIARDQEQDVHNWITQAAAYFRPIAPIPAGNVTSKTYATALGSTIYELQQEAKNNSVQLPPQYYFSFQVQNNKLTISSGLGPLAEQLGEVKTIAEILFAARVNELESIQRVRVSEDDLQGLQSDYIEERPITNDLAVITPYVLTFRSFTPELAKVITGFATSPCAFIVKSISVQPAGTMPDASTGAQPVFGQTPYAQVPAMGKGGLQTVIKEQLLRITLEVEIVKLLPKS